MRVLSYHEPRCLDEAVALLADFGAATLPVAGGTDLARARDGDALAPRRWLSLRSLPELRGVDGSRDEGLRIGAMTTHREAERSRPVQRYSGALTDAFACVGTIRIRNQGTVGGNLAQGDPRYDPPAMLLALDGHVVLARAGGTRTVGVEEFLPGPFATARAEDELVVGVTLPPRAAGARAVYHKLVPRGEAGDATVTVAAVVEPTSDGAGRRARVFLGAVGGVRVRLRRVEEALAGSGVRPAEAAAAAELAVDDAAEVLGGGGLTRYQVDLVRVCTGRALRRLAAGAAEHGAGAPAPRRTPGPEGSR